MAQHLMLGFEGCLMWRVLLPAQVLSEAGARPVVELWSRLIRFLNHNYAAGVVPDLLPTLGSEPRITSTGPTAAPPIAC